MADDAASLTVEILKQIRDGISQLDNRLGSRIDALGSRIDGLGSRIDVLHADLQETNSRLGKVEVKLDRVEVAIVRMGKVNDAVLEEQLKDSGRMDALEGRVRTLEAHIQELRTK